MNIQEKYENYLHTPSDINEHLPILFNLAKEVDSIIEFGCRNCISTTAFLLAIIGTEKTLVSYDLYKSQVINDLEKYTNFKFYQEDVLDLTIPTVDLLFIDTLHTYFQLTNELGNNSKSVRKYIVLHDTASYAYGDEMPYSDQEFMVMSKKVKQEEKKGLVPAIDDFLLKDDGLNWFVYKVYENNNGLTILKRK